MNQNFKKKEDIAHKERKVFFTFGLLSMVQHYFESLIVNIFAKL